MNTESAQTGEIKGSEAFTITNYGGGDLTYSITGDAPWLTLTPQSGTLPPLMYDAVEAEIDATNLTPGSYTAEITIAHNDPYTHDPLTVPAELTVTAGATVYSLSGVIIGSGAQHKAAGPQLTIRNIIVGSAASGLIHSAAYRCFVR